MPLKTQPSKCTLGTLDFGGALHFKASEEAPLTRYVGSMFSVHRELSTVSTVNRGDGSPGKQGGA